MTPCLKSNPRIRRMTLAVCLSNVSNVGRLYIIDPRFSTCHAPKRWHNSWAISSWKDPGTFSAYKTRAVEASGLAFPASLSFLNFWGSWPEIPNTISASPPWTSASNSRIMDKVSGARLVEFQGTMSPIWNRMWKFFSKTSETALMCVRMAFSQSSRRRNSSSAATRRVMMRRGSDLASSTQGSSCAKALKHRGNPKSTIIETVKALMESQRLLRLMATLLP